MLLSRLFLMVSWADKLNAYELVLAAFLTDGQNISRTFSDGHDEVI